MNRVIVSYKDDRISEVLIENHTGYAESGQDIVCAGISAITFGALNAISQLFEKDCRLGVDPEETRISIIVLKNSEALQLCLDFMLIQLKTIQEEYPDYMEMLRKEIP